MGKRPYLSFAGLADIAENQGNTKRFARLVGALEGHDEADDLSIGSYVDWLPKAEERIKRDPELIAEWEKGKAMSLDEAVAYALDDKT